MCLHSLNQGVAFQDALYTSASFPTVGENAFRVSHWWCKGIYCFWNSQISGKNFCKNIFRYTRCCRKNRIVVYKKEVKCAKGKETAWTVQFVLAFGDCADSTCGAMLWWRFVVWFGRWHTGRMQYAPTYILFASINNIHRSCNSCKTENNVFSEILRKLHLM